MDARRREVEAIREEAERYIKLRIGGMTTTLEQLENNFTKTVGEYKRELSYDQMAEKIHKTIKIPGFGFLPDANINEEDARKIAALLSIYTAADEYLRAEDSQEEKYTKLQENISNATQDLCEFTEKYNNPAGYVKTIAIIYQLGKTPKLRINPRLLDGYQADARQKFFEITNASYDEPIKKDPPLKKDPPPEELTAALPFFAQNLIEVVKVLKKAEKLKAQQHERNRIADPKHHISTFTIDRTVNTITANKVRLTKKVQAITNTLFDRLSEEESIEKIIEPLIAILGLEAASGLLNAAPHPKAKSFFTLYLLERHFKEKQTPDRRTVNGLVTTYATDKAADFSKLYAIFEKDDLSEEHRDAMAFALLKNTNTLTWLLKDGEEEKYAKVIQQMNSKKYNDKELKELFKHWTKVQFEDALRKNPDSQPLLYGMLLRFNLTAESYSKLDFSYLPIDKIRLLEKEKRIAYLKNLKDWKSLGENEDIIQAHLKEWIDDFNEGDLNKFQGSPLLLVAVSHKYPKAVMEIMKKHGTESLNHPKIINQLQDSRELCIAGKTGLAAYLEELGKTGVSPCTLLEAIKKFQEAKENTDEKRAYNALLKNFPAFLQHTSRFEADDRKALLEISQLYYVQYCATNSQISYSYYALVEKLAPRCSKEGVNSLEMNLLLGGICSQNKVLFKGYLIKKNPPEETLRSVIDDQTAAQKLASLKMLIEIMRTPPQVDMYAGRLQAREAAPDNTKLHNLIQHLTNSLLLDHSIENIKHIIGITELEFFINLLENHPTPEIKKSSSLALLKDHIKNSEKPNLGLIKKLVNIYIGNSPIVDINGFKDLYAIFADIDKIFPEQKEPQEHPEKEKFFLFLANAFIKNKSIMNWLLDGNHNHEYNKILGALNDHFIKDPEDYIIKTLFKSWTKDDFEKALAINPSHLLIRYAMLQNDKAVESLSDEEVEKYGKELDIASLSNDKIKLLDKQFRIAYLNHLDSWKKLGENENILRARLDNIVHDFDEADVEKLKDSEYGLIASFKKHPNTVTRLIIKNHKRAIGWQLLETLDTGFLRKALEKQLHHDLESEWKAKWIYNLRHQLVEESFYLGDDNDPHPFKENSLVKRDLKINPKKFARHAKRKARELVLISYPDIIKRISKKTSRHFPYKNCLVIYLEKAGEQGVSANVLLAAIKQFQASQEGKPERIAYNVLLNAFPAFLEHTNKFEPEDIKALFDLYQLYRINNPIKNMETPEKTYENDPIIKALTSRLNIEAEKETNTKRRELLGMICSQNPELLAGYFARNKDKKPRESLAVTYLRTFFYGATVGFLVGVAGYFVSKVGGFFNVQVRILRGEQSATSKVLDIVKILAGGAATAAAGLGLGSAIGAFAVLVIAGAATAGLVAVIGRAGLSTAGGFFSNKWAGTKKFFGYDTTPEPAADHDFINGFLRSIQSEQDIKNFKNMMLDPANEEMKINFAKTLVYAADNGFAIDVNDPLINKDVLQLALSIQKAYQFNARTTSEKIVSAIGDIPKTILSVIFSPLLLFGFRNDWCKPAWLARLIHNQVEKALLKEVEAPEDNQQPIELNEGAQKLKRRASTTADLLARNPQAAQAAHEEFDASKHYSGQLPYNRLGKKSSEANPVSDLSPEDQLKSKSNKPEVG
ncbi:MAG: hypothetical protein K0R24_673 [Gammaproteobacteria bacterium]|jgi:hypothetical protein|nr:hypothetical protein [Gammaproteobacteria bacterium]